MERFYINLSALLNRYTILPQPVFTMDETGMTTAPTKQPKVLSRKSKRSVNKMYKTERGINLFTFQTPRKANKESARPIDFRQRRLTLHINIKIYFTALPSRSSLIEASIEF